jgi:hypothetical protein
MNRTYARIPAQFYRISLHTEIDNMTIALVPEQTHADLIARLLIENYGLRKGETITVSPTMVRPVDGPGATHIELAIR